MKNDDGGWEDEKGFGWSWMRKVLVGGLILASIDPNCNFDF